MHGEVRQFDGVGWAPEDRWCECANLVVERVRDWLCEVDLEGGFCKIREDVCTPTPAGAGAGAVYCRGGGRVAGREGTTRAFVVVKGEADLFEVIFALRATGRFTSGLDRGEEQRDEDADDCDDDEKL